MRSSLRLLQQQNTCQVMHGKHGGVQHKTPVGRCWAQAQVVVQGKVMSKGLLCRVLLYHG